MFEKKSANIYMFCLPSRQKKTATCFATFPVSTDKPLQRRQPSPVHLKMVRPKWCLFFQEMLEIVRPQAVPIHICLDICGV